MPNSGPNALIAEADALLGVIPELRSTAQIADLARLRARLVGLVEQFDERASKRGIATTLRRKAHFVLCALIDEVATSMPWGAGGAWEALNPMPAALGAHSGEGALRSLAQMAQDPAAGRDLRELIYMALTLGFDARARASGSAGAESLRARVAALLKRPADAAERSLSVHWRPAVGRAAPLASWLPLWVGCFIVAALLAALYFGLSLAMASKSDRVFAQTASLRLAAPVPSRASEAVAAPRLAPMLPAGTPGRFVRDEADRSVITLASELLFEPGSANLSRAADDALRPVAGALQRVAGRIQVIGHTDGHSERSARFPSDWDLSVEQARVISHRLSALGLAGWRVGYDGRADSEALAAGGPASAGVRDARIDIVLLVGR